MHITDKLIAALTPGTPMNRQDKIWRSLNTLATLTGTTPDEVMGVLHGDMATEVVIKAGKAKPGRPARVLVALMEELPALAVAMEPPPAPMANEGSEENF